MNFPRLCMAACFIITRDDIPDARYQALGAQPEFASVVRIVGDSTGSGSGVLVSPRWVLTAAHVVRRATPQKVTVLVNGERIGVRRFVSHPEYANKVGLAATAFDHALIELERDIATTPAVIDSALPSVGALVTLVGFGVGGQAARDTAGTRRGARNTVDQIGGTYRRATVADHLIFTDFDMPGREHRSTLGSPVSVDLEGSASGGDSGGGLFVQREGKWVLVATFSVSAVDIGSAIARDFSGAVNMFVGVAPHREWIRTTISSQ